MKQTQTILKLQFWTDLTVTAVMAVLFETEVLSTGLLAGLSPNTELVVTTLVELLSLLLIPVSLKMFKFKPVRQDLVQRKEQALRKWGVVRLGVLFSVLFVNTLLYYIYMNTAFGYLAIITLLCLPFVYPSRDRCLTETEEEQ
jgi:hypothetical protein